ncbi:hypothetical protein BH23BAC1_BH23BAC1_02570 [soil metagenome]
MLHDVLFEKLSRGLIIKKLYIYSILNLRNFQSTNINGKTEHFI